MKDKKQMDGCSKVAAASGTRMRLFEVVKDWRGGAWSFAFVLLATVLLAGNLGCSDDPDAEDYDEVAVWIDDSLDFTEYQTYGFVDIPEDQLDSIPEDVVTNIANVNTLVGEELQALGLTESETPDLEVGTLAYTIEQSALVYDCVPGTYWWGYWGGYSSCAWVDVDQVDYDLGTMIVALGDTALQTMAFVGVFQGIEDSSSDAQQRITDAIDEMFSQYPTAPESE